MRRLMWRFGFNLRTNNNVRWATVWIGIIFLLFFNLIVIGVGPPLESTFEDLSPDAVEILKTFRGDLPAGEPALSQLIRLSFWSFLGFATLFGIVYTPVTFWDEIQRAWRDVGRRFREERGQAITQPSGQPGTQPALAQAQPQALSTGSRSIFTWIREVIAAAIANAFFH